MHSISGRSGTRGTWIQSARRWPSVQAYQKLYSRAAYIGTCALESSLHCTDQAEFA